MCIRDSHLAKGKQHSEMAHRFWEPSDPKGVTAWVAGRFEGCLLYTSDAADERSSVDLGGRRIIKKKNK